MKGARQSTALNSQGGNPDGSTNGLGGTGSLPNSPVRLCRFPHEASTNFRSVRTERDHCIIVVVRYRSE
jgi:hypothetical protein